MNSSNLKHKNLYFFDKNGEYCNFSYEGFVGLTRKPFDWDYNRTSYYKLDPNDENEYIHCDEDDRWGEDPQGHELFYYMKSDKWVGDIYLDDVATNLFSVGRLLILEKDENGNYRLPWKKQDEATGNLSYRWIGEFNEDLDDIFLFGYDKDYINYTQTALSQEPDGPDIIRTEFVDIPLSDKEYISKEAAVINFALCSAEENTFRRTLYIYEANEDYETVNPDPKENLVAVITIYGKTIGEDERFKTICENFGYNIIDTDTIAFEKTNIKEILPDWAIINEKRKEIILEGHNIYPYIGAYKGIINAIKYFGYNELQLREFWRNVDPNSPYYGKYVQSDCINFLSVDNVRFNQPKVTLPSKQYRKTSLFALVYKINDITEGAYDEDNLPLTHENQVYTQEEILIKLFALKRKLEKDFLPLNARIKDIIGEADFFTLNELTNSIGVNVKNNIQVGISPSFTVINGEKYNELDDTIYANLVDLRTFLVEYYNSTTNSVGDSPVTFYDASKKASGLVSWWNMFVSPRDKYSLIIDNELVCLESIMSKGAGDDNFSVEKLKETYLAYFKDYSPNLRYTGYWEEGRQPEYLGDVDPLPDNWHFVTNFSINDNKEYGPYDSTLNFKKWNDPENVPVGALVLLKNTTFDKFIFDNEGDDEIINDLEITYNELSKGNKYDVITLGLENFVEYGYNKQGELIEAEEDDELVLNFEDKVTITYITTKEDTINSIMKSIYVQCLEKKNEFPELFKNVNFCFNDNSDEIEIQGIDAYKFEWKINHPMMPSEFEHSVESNMRYSVTTNNRKSSDSQLFSWDNINKYDTTGIEWIIKKDADNFSPSYYFNSFEEFNDKDINKYNELPIVLPYIGKYTVEMRLYNMYNHMSSLVKKDFIEVVGREVEFSGWYTSQEESNGFEQEENNNELEIIEDSNVEQDVSEQEESDLSLELLEYWSSKAVTQRNNEYTWERCKDFKIGEYGSPFENAIKPLVTWGEATSSLYEGLDNANVIENNTLDTYDRNSHTSNLTPEDNTFNKASGSHSNKGAYIWKNCKCTWNEAYHKSWDTTEETGDIPFYIDIDRAVIGREGNELQWAGAQTTELGENNIVQLEYDTPMLTIDLQEDFKTRNYIEESVLPFEYEMSHDMNFVELYERLSEWLSNSYNIDIERYVNVNYIYNDTDYIEDYKVFVSDEKLYLEHSINEQEFKYYEVTNISESSAVIQESSSADYEYTVYYLKQITNTDFEKIGDSFKAYLTSDDIVRRSDETNPIPIVNINKLKRLSNQPYYTEIVGDSDHIEQRFISPGEMYDAPTDEHGNVITDFIEGLVPWKYYKHLVGKIPPTQEQIDADELVPKTWYYSYITIQGEENTNFINRLTPTLEPIEGINYTEASNLQDAQYGYKDVTCSYVREDFPSNPERYRIKNNENYTKSFVYYEYPLVENYDYYAVIPCKKYRVIPYLKYSYKPNVDLSDPIRMQLVGKYNSQICDIFDVDCVWNIVENPRTPIEESYRASLGLEDTGIIQHNTEIHNPTWNNVNFINSWKKLPKLTRICFTYDKCKILGKRNPTWTFKNITTGTEKVIKSKYGMYLFTESGDYSITLELYDSNKNKYIATKNYLTII